mmetsp:Transcript_23378/g.50903  ORF Transcript_23378/g.50903 Transcript_23378/m.50903 type:complete len:264 (+) Transcript_23378:61-852(+)
MADFPDFPITVLVATTKSGGIAYQGELPWPIDKDVCPFGGIKLPERSAVIMGRKTWSSIPSAYRPLRDHLNVALTSGDPTDFPEGVVVAASFAAALESLQGRVQGAFAIGGSSVFDQAMRLPQCFELQVTTVSEEFKADHFLQPPSGFWPLFQKDVGKSSVTWWRRLQPEVYHQLSFWKETARRQEAYIRQLEAAKPLPDQVHGGSAADFEAWTTALLQQASSSDEQEKLQEIIKNLQREDLSRVEPQESQEGLAALDSEDVS